MARASRLIGWSALALLAGASALVAHTWFARPLSIDWFYERAFLQDVLDEPEYLTFFRLLEPYGIRGHNAKWTDRSEGHVDRSYARLERDLAALERYDADGRMARSTGQSRISFEILRYNLRDRVEGRRWRHHNYPVNHLFGVQSELLNLLVSVQQVNDATDAAHYIARVESLPAAIAQVIEAVRLRAGKGIVPPRVTLDHVIAEVRGVVDADPAQHPINVAFRDKLAAIPPERMDATTRAALQARVEMGVTNRVVPAYRDLLVYLEELRPQALRNDGVWALPDGDRYYQYAIAHETTTRMTADEIHALGLAEVARIGAAMDAILATAGYTQATRAGGLAALTASAGQFYANDETGRSQILAEYRRLVDEIGAGLDAIVLTPPKAALEVLRVPPFTENAAASAYYRPPSLDGQRPGQFFVNLRDTAEQPKFLMRTLVYHEAIPGHHLQSAVAAELAGLPRFRSATYFSSYNEGWALYAEQLAWELGFLSDPLDDLGRLRDEMMRAVRLVVDTGLHARRWTREQAIEYMVREAGMPEPEAVSEIERYLVMPAQALSYKVGMIKILELRERARAALGSRFDLRRFHEEVLRNGEMPLEVLEMMIDEWIASQR